MQVRTRGKRPAVDYATLNTILFGDAGAADDPDASGKFEFRALTPIALVEHFVDVAQTKHGVPALLPKSALNRANIIFKNTLTSKLNCTCR